MAARRNRSTATQPAAPAVEKTQSQTPAHSANRASPKIVFSILGGFAAVSLLYLFVSWGGYQIERRTVLAERALEAEQWAEAIPHLEYIVNRYPAAWLRLRQLGDCYLNLGEPKKALDYYDKSLSFEPEQGLFARRGRAHYLLNPGSQEAIEFLQQAYDKDPDDPEVNYYIGLFYMNQGNYAKAAERFQAAAGDPKIYERAKPELQKIREQLLGTGVPQAQ